MAWWLRLRGRVRPGNGLRLHAAMLTFAMLPVAMPRRLTGLGLTHVHWIEIHPIRWFVTFMPAGFHDQLFTVLMDGMTVMGSVTGDAFTPKIPTIRSATAPGLLNNSNACTLK